jgi:hypothetical protein
MMTSPRSMLTLAWNPTEFHFVDVLPNGARFALHLICLTSWIPADCSSARSSDAGPENHYACGQGRVRTPKMMDAYLESHRLRRLIIRQIHPIWHCQISLCLGSLRRSRKEHALVHEARRILSELPLRCSDQLLTPSAKFGHTRRLRRRLSKNQNPTQLDRSHAVRCST